MLHAASLCIQRDSHARPQMSQVLDVLERDMVVDPNCLITPVYDMDSQNGQEDFKRRQLVELQVQKLTQLSKLGSLH